MELSTPTMLKLSRGQARSDTILTLEAAWQTPELSLRLARGQKGLILPPRSFESFLEQYCAISPASCAVRLTLCQAVGLPVGCAGRTDLRIRMNRGGPTHESAHYRLSGPSRLLCLEPEDDLLWSRQISAAICETRLVDVMA